MPNEFVTRNGLISQNNAVISGSFTVITGSGVELSVTPSGVALGNQSSDVHSVTGSLNVSGSTVITGSLTVVTGSSIELQVTNTGVKLGNALTDIHNVTGSLRISGSSNILGSGSSVFTVDGTSGRLFSVDDSLSGSLFSVNTAAGLPVVEAFSDNTVRIGQYGQRVLFVSQSRVGVGKESALTATLDVSGSMTVTGSVSYANLSAGSVPFIGAGGLITQSNSDFFWDNTNKRLYVGTNTAVSPLYGKIQFVGSINNYNTILHVENTDNTNTGYNVARFIGNYGTSAGIGGNTEISLQQKNSTVGNYALFNFLNANTQGAAYFATKFVNHNTGGSQTGDFFIGTYNAGTGSPKLYVFSDGNTLIQNGGTFTNSGERLQVSGSVRVFTNTTATSGSSYFNVSQSLTQPAQTGSQIASVNITPTFTYTAPNQTQTALKVNATFTGSAALTSSQANIIADFSSTSAGSQLTVTDVTSGSIYMVNDVSGLPIIEATSNWDVNIYDYPRKVFQKSGSIITVSGSFNTSGSITIGSGSGDLIMYGHRMFSIGQFQNNSTLSGSINVSQSFVYDVVDYSEGVTLVSGSRLTVSNAGYYNIQFSSQLQNTVNTSANVWIWFKKNGTNVPESATRMVLRKDEYHVAAWNFSYYADANDYFEIVWQSDSTDTRILYEPASGNIPIIPSIITTVVQIR